jgi:predicted Abi (CAAX) family protease
MLQPQHGFLLRRLVPSLFVRPTIQGGVSVLQSCCLMACCTGGCIAMGWTNAFVKRIPFHPSYQHGDKDQPVERLLFLRVLMVPSLFEEVLWRVLLQPPNSSTPYILWINTLFAISHMLYAPVMRCAAPFTTRFGRVPPQVPPAFSDPTFITLACVLGNLCSYTYWRSGFALWAPVLLHAITVTVWLSHFGGNEALGRRG